MLIDLQAFHPLPESVTVLEVEYDILVGFCHMDDLNAQTFSLFDLQPFQTDYLDGLF